MVAQREATRTDENVRSGPPPNGDYGFPDAFQTDDEYARKVVAAWREAGVLPPASEEDAETSRNGHAAVEKGNPEPRALRHVRRATAMPTGTIDYLGRNGAIPPPRPK